MLRCGSVSARIAASGGGTPTFLGTHSALSSTANVSSLTSASWSVSGSNRFLLAFPASGAGSPVGASEVRWGGSGGTTLTKQGSTVTIGSFGALSMYSLVAPTAQSSTSYYLWPSAQDETAAGTMALTGVNQTTPLGPIATASGNGTSSLSAPVTVTSVAGDLVVGAIWLVDTGGAARTITGDGTTLYSDILSPYEYMLVQSKVATGTSTTLTFTISGSTDASVTWGIIAAAVKG